MDLHKICYWRIFQKSQAISKFFTVNNFNSHFTQKLSMFLHTQTYMLISNYHTNRLLVSMLCICAVPIMYWKSFVSLENETGLGITSSGMWHGVTGHLVPNILQSSGPTFKGHKDFKTLVTKYSVM